jgi:PKD repeat protein
VYASYSVSGGDVAFFAEGTGLNDFWDFGDGNSNIGKDVSHTYSSPGTYNYCFTRDSCAPICGSIVVPTYCESNPVYSNFYVSNNGNGNFVINNYSSSGNGETYFWEFSDGSTSTSQNPNFTFIEDGLLCLTVVNDSLCEAVFCDSVIVSCNLASGFSYTDNGNGNYSFANTSSGGFDAFSWSFGDGYTSSAMNPNHTFASNGIYTVVLAIADSIGGCMDYFTSTINVVGVSNPLLCNAGFSVYTDSISNGVNVVNSSTGSNLTYFWDFGDGNTSTQAYPSYTYSTAGPFELCLTVSSDSLCTSTYCDSIGAGGVVLKGGGFTINVIQPVVTAINENVELISDLMIYPNPFQNNVTISLDLLKETQVNVSVTDLLGNVIAIIANREMNGTNKLQWNAEGVSGGIYLLNVRTENALKVEKLILNR